MKKLVLVLGLVAALTSCEKEEALKCDCRVDFTLANAAGQSQSFTEQVTKSCNEISDAEIQETKNEFAEYGLIVQSWKFTDTNCM